MKKVIMVSTFGHVFSYLPECFAWSPHLQSFTRVKNPIQRRSKGDQRKAKRSVCCGSNAFVQYLGVRTLNMVPAKKEANPCKLRETCFLYLAEVAVVLESRWRKRLFHSQPCRHDNSWLHEIDIQRSETFARTMLLLGGKGQTCA